MIVKNGMIALPGKDEFARADLEVTNGKFGRIAADICGSSGETVVDASGLLVFPGAIDPHVHFDEPGFTEREDFLHGTSEAARGGVTTVIDMPCTSLPPVTTLAALENKLSHISKSAIVDFALFGGVSGHEAEASISRHMRELSPFVAGFKTYFISGMDTFTRVDHFQFERIVKEAARLGRPVLVHAEDFEYIANATRFLKERRGSDEATWEDYVDSRPESAELVAAASAIALALGREACVHIVHVGTADAAELIDRAGATCETCPHYLAFSRDDFAALGSSLKTAPPVKSKSEKARLWELLANGTILFAASDHAPASYPEKHTPSVWTDYGGIPGTGTLFPYLLSEGFFSGKLSLSRFLEITASRAAERYGLVSKGSIKTGKDADFSLVDPGSSVTFRGSDLLSKGKITPFDGMTLKGNVVKTCVRGTIVYDSTKAPGTRIVAPAGYGIFKKWGE